MIDAKMKSAIQDKQREIQIKSQKEFGSVFRVLVLAMGLVNLCAAASLVLSMGLIGPFKLPVTVQTLFPSYAVGGVQERLVMYFFILCGACRIVSGLGIVFGGSRTMDRIAASSFLVELLMYVVEGGFFESTEYDLVETPLIVALMGAILTIAGTLFEFDSDSLYKNLETTSTTNSLFRGAMIVNGLADLVALGAVPLLTATKLIPDVGFPPIVQTIFPSFAVGGVEERFVLYFFILCGFIRIGAGLGLFFGTTRTVDFVAMVSYGVELLMAAGEAIFFKTDNLSIPVVAATAGMTVALLLGSFQAYGCDNLYSKAKKE